MNFVRWNRKAIRDPFVVWSLVRPISFPVMFTRVFGQVATSALGGGADGLISSRA